VTQALGKNHHSEKRAHAFEPFTVTSFKYIFRCC
jgi:hypothetical protein